MKSLLLFLLLLVVGMACGTSELQQPNQPQVIAEFVVNVDPAAGTFDIETIGTAQSARGIAPITVVQDGNPGTGPANTVDLVTTNTGNDLLGGGACGPARTFCGDVTINNFYGVPLYNVYVELFAIIPSSGNEAQLDDPDQMGLSSTLGLWRYGTITTNGMVRWILGDQGTPYTVRGRVMADLVPPASCNAILTAYPGTPDGTYTIDIDGAGATPAFDANCDMTLAGGGWTEITMDLALNTLGATMGSFTAAATSGFDASFRPYTQDASGSHTHYYDIPFAPFNDFYLSGYELRANGSSSSNTSEIETAQFTQTAWNPGYGSYHGDVSFGSAADAGPTTSFAVAPGFSGNFESYNATLAWPDPTGNYTVGVQSTTFRIGWGEGGSQAEGWFPWWAGSIYLR